MYTRQERFFSDNTVFVFLKNWGKFYSTYCDSTMQSLLKKVSSTGTVRKNLPQFCTKFLKQIQETV